MCITISVQVADKEVEDLETVVCALVDGHVGLELDVTSNFILDDSHIVFELVDLHVRHLVVCVDYLDRYLSTQIQSFYHQFYLYVFLNQVSKI